MLRLNQVTMASVIVGNETGLHVSQLNDGLRFSIKFLGMEHPGTCHLSEVLEKKMKFLKNQEQLFLNFKNKEHFFKVQDYSKTSS